MAKNYSELQSVMEILRQVFKLPRRNKKIFFFIYLSTILSYSAVSIAGMFAIFSLASGLSKDALTYLGMDPKSPEYQNELSKIKQDTAVLILFEIIYVLVVSVVSLVSIAATIYVSAMSYLEKDLTLKGLFQKMKQIWIRPVVTWFYIFLLSAGFLLLLTPIIVVMVLSWKGSVVVTAVGVVLMLAAMVLNIYLVLLWMLSLVVSVLEDCHGLQAIAKAEELVKGRKAVGLVLTFALMLPDNALAIVYIMKNQPTEMLLMMKNQPTEMLLIAFVLLFLGILVKILGTMMYTVLYFDCKERRGERVEVEEELKYSALSTIHP